ncbi:MAG: hypothetical protein ABSG77_07415 [Candidatus Acidiferrum sp.]
MSCSVGDERPDWHHARTRGTIGIAEPIGGLGVILPMVTSFTP